MKAIGVAVAVISCFSAFVAGRSLAVDPFVIADSKGRVRVKSIEDGDSFGLLMLDHQGRERLVINCSREGFPQVRMISESGKVLVGVGQQSIASASCMVESPDGPSVNITSDARAAMLYVGGPDAAHSILAVNADRSELLLAHGRGKEAASVNLRQYGGAISALTFERSEERVAGFSVDQQKSQVWLGQSALDKSPAPRGMRLAWDADVGARLSMVHKEDAAQVQLQASASQGSGWQVGLGSGLVRGGLGADGTPKLLVTDKDGKEVLMVPGK